MAIDPIRIAAEMNIEKVRLAPSAFKSGQLDSFLDDRAAKALANTLAQASNQLDNISSSGRDSSRQIKVLNDASTALTQTLKNLNPERSLKRVEEDARRIVTALTLVDKAAKAIASGDITPAGLKKSLDELNKFKDVAPDIIKQFETQLSGEIKKVFAREVTDVNKEIGRLRKGVVDNFKNIGKDIDAQIQAADKVGNKSLSNRLKTQRDLISAQTGRVETASSTGNLKRDADTVKKLTEEFERSGRVRTAVSRKTQKVEQETNDILREQERLQKEDKQIFKTDTKRAKSGAKEELAVRARIEAIQRKGQILLEKTVQLRKAANGEVTEEERKLRALVAIDAQRAAANRSVRSGVGNRLEGIIDQTEIERISRAAKETNVLNSSIKNARIGVDDFGRSIALAFKRYGAFLIGGGLILRNIIGFFRQSTNEALEFERGITKVQQVLATTDGFAKRLSESVRQASRETGVVASEISEGLLVFAQSGVREQQDLLAITREIAKVPLSATFDDIKGTSEGLIAIFGQFNKTATDTSQVLSLVNQFAADFAIESGDFFEAAKRGGAAFSTAGGSLEDFVQLLSILRESTRENATTLGTFFKTGLGQLLQPSSQSQLRELGVTATSVTGQLTQLATIIADDRFSSGDRINIARELTGQRQFARLLSLLREIRDPEVQKRLQDSINAAPGSFDRSIETRLDDIGTNLTRIRQGVFDFINALTEDQSLKSFINLITELSTTFLGLSQNLTPVIPLLAAGVAPLIARGVGGIAKSGLSQFGLKGGGVRNIASGLSPFPVRIGNRSGSEVINRGNAIFGKGFGRRQVGQRLGRLGAVGAFTAGSIGAARGGSGIGSLGVSGQQVGGAATQGVFAGLLAASFTNPLTAATIGVVVAFNELRQASLNNVKVAEEEFIRRSLLEGRPGAATSTFLGSSVLGPQLTTTQGLGRDLNRQFDQLLQDTLGGSTLVPNARDVARNQRTRDQGNILSNLIDDPETLKSFGVVVKGLLDAESKNLKLPANTTNEEASRILRQNLIKSLRPLLTEAGLNIPNITSGLITLLEESGSLTVVALGNIPRVRAEILTGIDNFKQAIVSTLDTASDVLNNGRRDLDQLNSINANPLQLQTLTGNTNNTDLLGQAGFSTFVDNVLRVNDQISADLQAFFADNREITRAFFENQSGEGSTDANLADTLKSIFSSDGSEGVNPLIQDIVTKFGDSFNRLAAEGDLTFFELFSKLIGETDFDKAVEGIRNTADIEKRLADVVRQRIEIFNRRLQIERELANNILNTEKAIFQLNAQISTLTAASANAALEQEAFIKNFNAVTKAIAQANLATGQAGQSSFGSTSQFVQEALTAARQAFADQTNVSGGAGRGLQEQQDLISKAASSQQEFIRIQSALGQRLGELQTRVQSAARASQLLRQAFETSVSGLQSFGSSVSQLTTQELAKGINALRDFRVNGLESLNRGQFDSLQQLLSSAGDVNLGGGLTGADLLGDINQSLGIEAAAAIRAALTGSSIGDSRNEINAELEALRKQQEQAAQLEEKLREEQKQLLNLQVQLQQEELQFFKDQNVLLQDISTALNTGFNNLDFKAIQEQVGRLFNTALPVTDEAPTGGTIGIDPRSIQAPPQIVQPRTNPVVPNGQPQQPFNPLGPITNPNPFAPARPRLDPNDPRLNPDGIIPANPPFDPFAPQRQQRPDLIFSGETNTSNANNFINSDLSTLNQNIENINSVLERIASDGFRSILEIQPINVNVQLAAPDIVRQFGPQIKTAIMSEIALKLSDIFEDNPEVSGRIASELGNS